MQRPGYHAFWWTTADGLPGNFVTDITQGVDGRLWIIAGGGGGVLPGYEAELRFDGATYPTNPTVPPAEPASDTAGAEIVIPDFTHFTEGKLVTPR